MRKTKKTPLHWQGLLFFVGITLLAGVIGSLLGGDVRSVFAALEKPPLTPPAIVFPIVWTILYILMGIAAFLVFQSGDLDRGVSLRLYLLQLLVNVLWPLLFFRMGWMLIAFFWLLLIALVSLTMAGFRYICRLSFLLMLPYLLWCLYAAYLNLGFYLLNRL